ncbi:MAG: hypothetical protein HQ592_08350, partial [Planctomycetes bacterium]|nr:hypothetical protein [Planctomycetota bacterium]
MTQPKRKSIEAVAVIAVLAIACAASFAEQAVDNLKPPVLRDVMWQLLPRNVLHVTVGPDGRIWWQMKGEMDQAAACWLIEQEFGKEQPALCNARPVLFEPGGRVWFAVDGGKLLCAYDGKSWIMRQAADGLFCGNAPSHGRRNRTGYNCIVNGRLFFIASGGVHCFDPQTNTWSYQQMLVGRCWQPLLFPEPDGGGVVAFYRQRQTSQVENALAVWRWRDGAWTRIQIPDDLSGSRMIGVRVAPAGIWIDEGRYATRPQKGVQPRAPLLFIPFDPAQGPHRPDKAPQFTVGPYVARDVHLAFDDDPHAAYLRAMEVFKDGELLGPGMLIERKDGSVSLLKGIWLADIPRYSSGWSCTGPIEAPKSAAVWVPSKKIRDRAVLYSVETGSRIMEVPLPRFGFVHAVRPDGTAFLSIGDSGRPAIIVFKHSAEDEREQLATVSKFKIRNSCFSVAPDGSVWANCGTDPEMEKKFNASLEIVRFDGESWGTVEALRNFKDPRWIVHGQNNELLARCGKEYILMLGDECYASDDLEMLISAHREECARAFLNGCIRPAPSYGGGAGSRECEIVADAARNIWMLADELKLLMPGQPWIKLTDKPIPRRNGLHHAESGWQPRIQAVAQPSGLCSGSHLPIRPDRSVPDG